MNKKLVVLSVLFLSGSFVQSFAEVVSSFSPDSQQEMFKDAERLRIAEWLKAEREEQEIEPVRLAMTTDGLLVMLLVNEEILAMYPVQYLNKEEMYVFFADLK